VQEEERLKHDNTKSVNLESTSTGKEKKRKRFEAASGSNQKKHVIDKDKCFFYKKSGHQKKDCPRYHT